MKQSYKQYVTDQIGPALTARIGDSWQDKDGVHAHICKELRDNFLDGVVPMFCAVKGSLFRNRKIHYHRWARCLTSSQVLCINFFRKFFEKPEYEAVLLAVLRQNGLHIPENTVISNAIFEYEPDRAEGTNFDFYLILSNGQHISFEIKYTETEFGKISPDPKDPDKYLRKWNTIYRDLAARCPYLGPEFCDMQIFYDHYQISRNIVRTETDRDLVVFLTPQSNHALDEERAYIDRFENPNIRNLSWEALLAVLCECSADYPELRDYFCEFAMKYFTFIPADGADCEVTL